MKRIFSLLLLTHTLALFLLILPHTAHAQALRYFEFDFNFPYPDSLNIFASTNDSAVLAAVDAQLALPDSLRSQHINGPITHGTGDNNPRYSWHFVPSAWALADFSVEVCDGRPMEDVEADTAYWIGNIGYFCPWSSFVKREVFPTSILEPRRGGSFQLLHTRDGETLILRNQEKKSLMITDICDLTGRVVQNIQVEVAPGTAHHLDITGLPVGTYLLRCTSTMNGVEVLRFLRF